MGDFHGDSAFNPYIIYFQILFILGGEGVGGGSIFHCHFPELHVPFLSQPRLYNWVLPTYLLAGILWTACMVINSLIFPIGIITQLYKSTVVCSCAPLLGHYKRLHFSAAKATQWEQQWKLILLSILAICQKEKWTISRIKKPQLLLNKQDRLSWFLNTSCSSFLHSFEFDSWGSHVVYTTY